MKRPQIRVGGLFLDFTPEGVVIEKPTEKLRGTKLSNEQQTHNKDLDRRRVQIKHAMGAIERCRAGKKRIRLRTSTIRDLVLEIICCHHTLRLYFRH